MTSSGHIAPLNVFEMFNYDDKTVLDILVLDKIIRPEKTRKINSQQTRSF